MEFQIVSHACVSIRAADKTLVIDPWLAGPVYWGAWAHCPEPVYDDDIFQADFVYITHWHFDHLHAASLRRFHPDTHFLVPRFPVSNLVETLNGLGFQTVTELGHGRAFELAPGFQIRSYQISFQDDSACFVEADGVVIANLNDAKPLPRTWRAIQAAYPKVDFMLRSHSPAWSYPSRFTFDDPNEAITVTRESYMAAWRAAAAVLRPRYGIPFASGVCHPHREVLDENEELVTDEDLDAFMRTHPLAGTEVVVMPPGSRWSQQEGFDCRMENQVRDVGAYLAEHAEANSEWLKALYDDEENATVAFERFEAFFQDMLGCSVLVPARTFLAIKLVFEIEQEGHTQFWSVDFRSGRVARHPSPPTEYTSLIRVPPAVLDAALRDREFTNIDISKRWHVHVGADGMTKHLIAWGLISLYEAGYLKLGNLLHRRVLSEGFARRSEAVDYLALCWSMVRRGSGALTANLKVPPN